jgi:carbon-monoxide dehydrogenase small subunit
VRITATVNGEPRQADDVWEGESLLYVLRERMGLPGSKNACEQGECGSCTVYLDDIAVCACLVAAGQAAGAAIVTVEGLARVDVLPPAGGAGGKGGPTLPDGTVLHPVQQAFIEAGAVQCGFCTPGLLIAAHAVLRNRGGRRPSDAEIREALAGNLCRCTGYEKILEAVRLAADRWEEDPS